MAVRGASMDIPSIRLIDMLASTAGQHGTNTATAFYGHELTYQQLFGAVRKLMGQLIAKGVELGDRVGIMAPNCPQYVIAYYAIVGVGGVVVQLNPMSTVPELTFLLRDSQPKLIFAYDKLLPVVQGAMAQDGVPSADVVAIGFGQADAASLGAIPVFEQFLAPGNPETNSRDFNPLETIAVLQYTGGTTGTPKGAMLTHANLVANAYQSYGGRDELFGEGSVILGVLPLFHVYAMTCAMNIAILFGFKLVLLPRFDPKEVVEAIKFHKVTAFPGVPTMYVAVSQVVEAGSDAFSALDLCNSGGAAMPVQVMEQFERLTGATVLEGYGLSEAAPVTHLNPTKEQRRVGSIGLPAANTEVAIVSVEDGVTELPPGEPGELVIRGPQVMKGYWNRPKETQDALLCGWLHTGDIAVMDEDGYAFIVDRKKDLIIASGYNVYPRDVEEALYRHPAILEAAVIGVPDDYRGETVKAVVALKPGQSVTAEEIVEFCRGELAAYKIPRIIEFRDSLPKTAVGKILRRALKEA